MRLIQGDCIEIMAAMEACSVDAIVCDPPYGLEFMGRDFDSLVPRWQDFKDVPPEWMEDYKHEDDASTVP